MRNIIRYTTTDSNEISLLATNTSIHEILNRIPIEWYTQKLRNTVKQVYFGADNSTGSIVHVHKN